jgi:phospholipid/cholesterol/gamma-HCH transport system ATP-binding protein
MLTAHYTFRVEFERDMADTDRKKVVELINVDKAFGDQIVLEHVNLPIYEGTTTVIVGPSGTGKSVTLKLMMGLMRPDSGQVIAFGQNISNISNKELRKIRMNFGVLFQNVALFDSMNIFDNIALPLRERTDATEKEIRRNVQEKLEMMGLTGSDDKFPAQLSGGMLKRAGLARALVLNPRIVFFDEPTTGLDSNKSAEIYRLFHQTQRELNYSAVIVSHDVPKIFKLSDYVVLLAEKKLHECVSPEDFQLSNNPAIRLYVEKNIGPIYSSLREEAGFYETF